jgi:alkylhydroperoxidase family enzyme
MAAADQLHARNTVDDAAWQDLAERYDEAQLIEIVALVGYYHQVAYLLNALGVAREEGIPGLPD